MSAHLQAIPPQIAFAANEMLVTLESDNIVPDRAYIQLILTDYDGPLPNETLTLTYRGTTHTFTFVPTPDNSGWQLPTRNATQTTEDWWAYVAERLRINPTIADEFDIVANIVNFSIRLTWRNTEPLSITQTNNLSYMSVTIHSVSSIVNVQNLTASLSVHDATTHEMLTNRIGTYDINTKRCIFDIQSAFEDIIPVPPDPSVTVITTATSSFRRYYLRYADRHGTPPQSEIRHKSPDLTALAGGTTSGTRTAFFQANAALLALHNWKTPNDEPFVKPITKTQPDWLFFTAIADEPNLTWTVRIHYAAGYRDDFTTNAAFSCAAGEVKCLPIGFTQLGLQNYVIPQAFDTSFVSGYEISIRRPNEVPLLTATYTLEILPHPWNLYLVFDNGLGGIESVRLKGKKQINYASDMSNIEKSDGSLSVAFATVIETYDVSTGWYEYAYLQSLRQLLLGNAWVFDPKINELVAIIPEKQSFEFIEDDNDLHALQFKFRIAKTQTRANNY